MTTTFLKKYKVLEKIGEGSFSEVLKCQERENGALYAAKRLKKIYQNISEMLETPEVITMRKISRHPNILYLIESHYDPAPGKVTLIFQLMDMSLYDLVNGRKGRLLTEQRVKGFLYQLLKGLEHLHKHGIFHRDIKPENILLKGNVVKLADLGSIRGIYSRPPYTEYISTRWYRSPECLLTTGFYGPKMDVWATGCVYYELLTLKPLFPGSNEVDQIAKINSILGTPHARLIAKFRRHKSRNCEYLFPNKEGSGVANLLPHIMEGARDILKLMLVYDPENRSNVKRLLDNRYFNDLREKETSTFLLPNNNYYSSCCSRESNQWRNPVLLSYITSERNNRRKSKGSRLRRSKLDDEDNNWSKIPRVVASSPNARPSLSNNNGKSTFQKTNGNEITGDEERAWLNSKTSQSSDKLPPIKYASKMSRQSSKSLCSTRRRMTLEPVVTKSETKPNFRNKRGSPSCNSFLPEINLKSRVRNFRFAGGSRASAPSDNSTVTTNLPRQTKLATITEQRIWVKKAISTHRSFHKSPNGPNSPAKKIAKHEITPFI